MNEPQSNNRYLPDFTSTRSEVKTFFTSFASFGNKKEPWLQKTPLLVLLVPSFISFIIATLILVFFLTRH